MKAETKNRIIKREVTQTVEEDEFGQVVQITFVKISPTKYLEIRSSYPCLFDVINFKEE